MNLFTYLLRILFSWIISILFFSQLSVAQLSDEITFMLNNNGEPNTILSVVGGHFRNVSIDDVVYLDKTGSIYIRTSKENMTLNSSILINDDDNKYQSLWSNDLNGDGLDDLIVTGLKRTIYIFYANGTNGYFNAPMRVTATTGNTTHDATTTLSDLDFGFFNDDNLIDIAVIGTYSDATTVGGSTKPTTTQYVFGVLGIAYNNGNSTFTSPNLSQTRAVKTGSNAMQWKAFYDAYLAAGDFNGDNLVDVAVCYNSFGLVDIVSSIFPGTTDGTLDMENYVNIGVRGCQGISAILPNGPFGVTLPKSSKATLIFSQSNSYAYTYDLNWNQTSDTEMHRTPKGCTGPFNDFNNDGSADLMFTDGNRSLVTVGWDWSDTEDRKIKNKYRMVLGHNIQTGDYGDFNGDGKPDVIGCHKKNIAIYYNITSE